MMHVGISLVAVGVLAIFLPLAGRQFVLVTLLNLFGLSASATSVLLVLVGAALIYRSAKVTEAVVAPAIKSDSKVGWIATGIVALWLLVLVMALSGSNASGPTLVQEPLPLSHDQSAARSIENSQRPPLKVDRGELVLVGAISPKAGEIRIQVDAIPSSETSVLEGSPARAMRLFKPRLCSTAAVLESLRLESTAVTLSVYERGEPVGELPLSPRFCD